MSMSINNHYLGEDNKHYFCCDVFENGCVLASFSNGHIISNKKHVVLEEDYSKYKKFDWIPSKVSTKKHLFNLCYKFLFDMEKKGLHHLFEEYGYTTCELSFLEENYKLFEKLWNCDDIGPNDLYLTFDEWIASNMVLDENDAFDYNDFYDAFLYQFFRLKKLCVDIVTAVEEGNSCKDKK